MGRLAYAKTPFVVLGTLVAIGILITSLVAGLAPPNSPTPTNALVNIASSSCPMVEPRRLHAYQKRVNTAFSQYSVPVPCRITNGDEANSVISFSKGLPHDSLGHVSPSAYNALLKAVATGAPSDWDAVPLHPNAARKLVNPQAAWAFVLDGQDPQAFRIPPPPSFSSAAQAEILEVYAMALTRDIPFSDYAAHPDVATYAAQLGTSIPPALLFRGKNCPGCQVGGYVSQFLLQQCPFGANWIDQRINPPTSNLDFMTNFTTYLHVQNGRTPLETMTYDTTPVFIRNGRDLAHWVHVDVLFQAYFHAMLILLDRGVPLKSSLPTQNSPNQIAFGTFGPPFVAQMSTIGAVPALKAAWFQKWVMFRRLRPEAMGARIHNQKVGAATYSIHPSILNSDILTHIFNKYGTYLLPMAYSEGSPMHPSYAAGHATVAGACVTFLKALFVEEHILPNPVMTSADGLSLIPLAPHVNLTVGGELDKLAYNIALGRSFAGVHYTDSDGYDSLKLGEQVAVGMLRDMKTLFNEPFEGWTFVGFDGNQIKV